MDFYLGGCMLKQIMILALIIPAISFAKISIDPTIPNIKQSTTSELKLKAKTSQSQVKKHDGYRVIDSEGNEFYVDNINKPKNQVVINEINNKKSNVKVVSYVEIDSICFTLTCK